MFEIKRCCLVLSAVLLGTSAFAETKTYNLLELYQLAQKNDALFRAENVKYSAIRLNPKIARGDLLPQLGISADYTRVAREEIEGQFFSGGNGQSGSGNQSNRTSKNSFDTNLWSLNLTQTLFDKAKLSRLKQSKSEVEQAAFELKAARQDLILRLATAYFNILTSKSHLTFIQAEKEAVAKQLQQAQTRFEVGVIPITDAKEAQAAYDLTVANEIDARNDLENSYHQMEVITNRLVEELHPLSENAPAIAPVPDDMKSWVDRAVTGNFNVLAKKIAVNIASEEVGIQSAGHYPSLDMFAQYSESDIRGGVAPSEREQSQIGVRMNIPLFAGGKTHYQTRQAARRHRESMEVLVETQREVRKTAREAYLNVVASISRIKALEKALDSAQAAVDSNRAGFSVGTRTSAEVLIVLKDLFKTQRDYAEARHFYILNMLKLKQAAGTLAQNDIKQINKWLNGKER